MDLLLSHMKPSHHWCTMSPWEEFVDGTFLRVRQAKSCLSLSSSFQLRRRLDQKVGAKRHSGTFCTAISSESGSVCPPMFGGTLLMVHCGPPWMFGMDHIVGRPVRPTIFGTWRPQLNTPRQLMSLGRGPPCWLIAYLSFSGLESGFSSPGTADPLPRRQGNFRWHLIPFWLLPLGMSLMVVRKFPTLKKGIHGYKAQKGCGLVYSPFPVLQIPNSRTRSF